MPTIGVPTSTLAGAVPVPPGIYEVKLKGFKPAFSKDKNSINLNPKLAIVNTNGKTFECSAPNCKTEHPEGHKLEGMSPAWVNLNWSPKAGFILEAFVHAFGLEMVKYNDPKTGEPMSGLPGDISGKPDDPTSWVYTGPLLDPGRTARIEVIATDNTQGGTRNTVKQYFCKVVLADGSPCDVSHPTDLK